MTEHCFPWEHKNIIVAAFAKDDEREIEIFRCHVGEHGALFPANTTFLSLHERGWIPYAWKVDDAPERDDTKFPPLWTDYLTQEHEHD